MAGSGGLQSSDATVPFDAAQLRPEQSAGDSEYFEPSRSAEAVLILSQVTELMTTSSPNRARVKNVRQLPVNNPSVRPLFVVEFDAT
jgi:hypothetical protein